MSENSSEFQRFSKSEENQKFFCWKILENLKKIRQTFEFEKMLENFWKTRKSWKISAKLKKTLNFKSRKFEKIFEKSSKFKKISEN